MDKQIKTPHLIMLLLLAAALACLFLSRRNPSNFVQSAGLLFDLAGLVQLQISGVFAKIYEKIMAQYGDIEKYPYGPQSHIDRQLIHNPDTPVRTWLRNKTFFDPRTGFKLIVLGCVTQLLGIWLPQ